ncbi:RHS repeat domain-containing protein [Chryseobacterium sp. 22543]|jgi:hypothetical protein|uniref:RHS repeat domain-containing protein n=1 Tax=Chryseobacterium sp. 22543 TaxID=3453940 RepID=UPI003F8561A9
MKFFLNLLLFIPIIFIKGQGDPEPFNIPKVVPPSTESFLRTEYGKTPLNEYRGMASISIPIYNLKSNGVGHSINLNYAKIGVKVDDIPTSVGMSWVLESSGVINRTIYGHADETVDSSRRVYFNDLQVATNLANANEGTPQAAELASYLNGNINDTQVDIFNFTVPGYSGSFYLDKNLNPVLITDEHSYKISTVGNFSQTYAFVITTNKGVKFYLGGENAIETTANRESLNTSGITSFYLTKIEYPDGNTINFQYEKIYTKSIILSTTLFKSVISVSNQPSDCPPQNVPDPSTSVNSLRLMNPLKISKITSNNIVINFYYQANNFSFYDKLTSIDVLYKNEKRKTIDFTYIDGYDKFFLNKLQNYDYSQGSKTFENEYVFTYDEANNVPKKNAFSVDTFGYNNGKWNTTSVPDVNLLGANLNMNLSTYNLADRRADFNFAKKGTLTSITYPTKGSTHFEYESLGIKKQTRDNKTVKTNTDAYYPVVVKDSMTINGNIVLDNKITLNFNIHQDEPSTIPNNQGASNLKVIDITSNQILINQNYYLPKTEMDFNKLIEINTNPNNQYKIVITCLRPNIIFESSVNADYYIGYTKVEDHGLRLKKMYDKTVEGTISNIRRLYYSNFQNIHNADDLPLSRADYQKFFLGNMYFEGLCENVEGGPLGGGFYSIRKLCFTSGINNYTLSDIENDNMYPNVTISHGGDDFEKGGEIKIFSAPEFDQFQTLREPDSSNPYSAKNIEYVVNLMSRNLERVSFYDKNNGTLLKHYSFIKKNNNFFALKMTENNYQFSTTNKIYNLVGLDVYTPTLYPPNITPGTQLFNRIIGLFPITTYSNTLKKTVETDFMEDIPLTDVLSGVVNVNAKKIVQTNDYQYNNIDKQLTGVKVISPDQSLIETNYKYAPEKNNQYLISKNMIGIPLETEAKKNGKVISKAETLYPYTQTEADTKTIGLPLPISSLSQNISDGVMEVAISYDMYDNKGNLLQYTTREGIPVCIVWGYNQTVPIAKIEGVTYARLSGMSPSTLDIMNASNTDADAGVNNDETAFLSALTSFRANTSLSGYQITTYTYDPLVGVRSITSPSGIRESYIYDSAGRLEKVIDANGKVLKEMKYNYKN